MGISSFAMLQVKSLTKCERGQRFKLACAYLKKGLKIKLVMIFMQKNNNNNIEVKSLVQNQKDPKQ